MGAQDCKSAVSEGSENDVFLSLKIVFILANSADPGEMPRHWHFIRVFTVSQNTCKPESRMKNTEMTGN